MPIRLEYFENMKLKRAAGRRRTADTKEPRARFGLEASDPAFWGKSLGPTATFIRHLEGLS